MLIRASRVCHEFLWILNMNLWLVERNGNNDGNDKVVGGGEGSEEQLAIAGRGA